MTGDKPPPLPAAALAEARQARAYVETAVRTWNSSHDAQEKALAAATEELRLVREAVMMLTSSSAIERSLSLEVSRHLSSPPPVLKSERVREIAKSISNETELESARAQLESGRASRAWWGRIVASVVGGVLLLIATYILGRAGIK